MDPVDEGRGDVQVVEFVDHQVALDGVEGRTEFNEEQSGEVCRCFKMLEEGVEETCHSILRPSPGLVGKLVAVQLWADNWEEGYHGKCCTVA